MDNVWVERFNEKLQGEIISYFKINNLWDKVIWSKNELENNLNCDYYEDFPTELIDVVYKGLSEYIRYETRNSKLGGFQVNDKVYDDFKNEFWEKVYSTYIRITSAKIDLVIFNRPPHYGSSYILYLLAKTLRIKTLILQQSQFPNRFHYFFNQEDYGNFETSEKLFDPLDYQVNEKSESDLFYMRSVKANKTLLQQIHKYFNPEYRLFKELFVKSIRPTATQRYHLKKVFLKNYKNAAKEDVDLNVNYIYFPLHLQPELSTDVWGGKYVDQLLALEHMSRILPKGWLIYAKENPKQNYVMRGKSFYRRLNKLSKVKYIDKKINTYQLIENSQIVATITGTVGLEALRWKKPVIHFGWGTWYKKFNNVYEFNFELNLNEIANDNVEIEYLRNDISKLSMKLAHGVIYPGYSKMVLNFDEKLNQKAVCESIKKILKY